MVGLATLYHERPSYRSNGGHLPRSEGGEREALILRVYAGRHNARFSAGYALASMVTSRPRATSMSWARPSGTCSEMATTAS